MKYLCGRQGMFFDLIARNVARRYAAVIDQGALDKWVRDLKVMTRIYRAVPVSIEWDDSVGLERAYEQFREAERLFRVFRNGFEEWVYKVILPKLDKEEAYLVKELRSSTWTFLSALGNLFPTVWDGRDSHNVTYNPSLSELKAKREGNIKRYQVAFTKVYKQLTEYIASKGGTMVRYDAVDHLEVAGVPVTIENLGRDEREDGERDYVTEPLNLLGKYLNGVKRAGFGVALEGGFSVTFNFVPGHFETAGMYTPSTDKLIVYPLGMVGEHDGHTLIHEIGHRFWFKCLPGQGRALWEKILSDRGVTITEKDVEHFYHVVVQKIPDDPKFMDTEDVLRLALPAARGEGEELKFRELAEVHFWSLFKGYNEPFDPDDYLRRLKFKEGELVQVEEVSDYGDTDPVEGFAEVFRLWVTKGPRAIKPFTRELFVQICRAGGARVSV